jgi:hypothetical protein
MDFLERKLLRFLVDYWGTGNTIFTGGKSAFAEEVISSCVFLNRKRTVWIMRPPITCRKGVMNRMARWFANCDTAQMNAEAIAVQKDFGSIQFLIARSTERLVSSVTGLIFMLSYRHKTWVSRIFRQKR